MAVNDTFRPIPDHNLAWLVIGMFLCFLPHITHLPVWISVMTAVFFGWKLYQAVSHRTTLTNKQKNFLRSFQKLMVLVGFIGVFLTYRTLVGRDAGSALLLLLAGFKILETSEERDFYISTFLGFFIIITNFFYSQSMPTALFMLLTVIILMASLVAYNDRSNKLSNVDYLRIGSNLLLQTLPFMLLTFLLFPRIDGPLWGLPKDAYKGLIGISDEMEPGSLNELIGSNAVAFRVEFNGDMPVHNLLYWRGPVLWYDDGKKWTRPVSMSQLPGKLVTFGKPVSYTVTMEPTNKKWLFALEMPDSPPADGYIAYDQQYMAKSPVKQRIQYQVNSYTSFRLDYAEKYELQRALQLPLNKHPRAVALGRNWREKFSDPEQIIEQALNMFRKDDFYYTLKPPLLKNDNVDEFLFDTRKGFCEHYTAAFVTLMRAAGIPARVVTGYLGGTLNPIGNYLVVYQRDAHAWAEVWLNDRGWTRIDPTSAVSPARVEQGIEIALPDEVKDIPSVFGVTDISRDFWINLRNTWDSINNQWNQWFISYGPQRQELFLKMFGFEKINLQWLAVGMMMIISILFLLLAYWFTRQVYHSRDPARYYYDKFCNKLASIGVKRRMYEGPLDFAARISSTLVRIRGPIEQITNLYIAARYAEQPGKLGEFKQAVNAFEPAKIIKHRR